MARNAIIERTKPIEMTIICHEPPNVPKFPVFGISEKREDEYL